MSTSQSSRSSGQKEGTDMNVCDPGTNDVSLPPVSGAGGSNTSNYFDNVNNNNSGLNLNYFDNDQNNNNSTNSNTSNIPNGGDSSSSSNLPTIDPGSQQEVNTPSQTSFSTSLSTSGTGGLSTTLQNTLVLDAAANGDRVIPEANIREFTLGTTLGTGSFGRVRFATETNTGQIYAIKILKKTAVVKLQQITHILDEKKILSRIAHPFIVNLMKKFQDTKYLYLYLEYIIGGEFFSWLRKEGRFSNNATRFYAAQITSIFEYLHSKDIVYRDLKPENLLIDRRGYLKLTDFGFAKEVKFKTFTLCGTPEYIAPEVLLNKGHGKGVDWWTLGILIFETLCGQPPFNDDDHMGIYQQIIQGKVVFPRIVERDAKSLIKHLLVQDLTKRYGCMVRGADDIKEHRWFSGMNWEGLLQYELTAPFIPPVENEHDTKNFEQYPDSTEEVQDPVYPGEDPFTDF